MPDQEIGVVLIVLGVVFMVLGFFVPLICAVGIVLLVVGIVLAAMNRPSSPYPAGYYQPYPPPAYGAPAPPAQPQAPGQPATAAQTPACYVCGSPLSWVPQYGRWYCARCQAYR